MNYCLTLISSTIMDAGDRARQARQLRRFLVVQRRNRVQNFRQEATSNHQTGGVPLSRGRSVCNAIFSHSIVNADGTIATRTHVNNLQSNLRDQGILQEQENLPSNITQLPINDTQG